MTMTIRLFIVDDHALMRAGLRMLLESQSDFTIVGECDNGGDAIRAVAQGGMYLYPSLAQDYLKHADTPDEARSPSDGLTERKLEVVKLIADGLSNAEVAERLTISVKTVERHRANIFAKLNLHSRTKLVKYAIRKGLIDIEDRPA